MNKITVDEWIALFRETGLDDATMQRWHRLFEQHHPEAHQSFWNGSGSTRRAPAKSALPTGRQFV